MKEFKVQIPKGYEIDKEKSTFENIVFKPINENITYDAICDSLFKENSVMIDWKGNIDEDVDSNFYDLPFVTYSENQLNKMIALNKLYNIAEYFNKNKDSYLNHYIYKLRTGAYCVTYGEGLFSMPSFKTEEDAHYVIDHFQNILDKIFI